MKKVEVYYFEDCPNAQPAIELVRETIAGLKIDAEVQLVQVKDHDDALACKFLGSPSIRIDGKDLEAGENATTQYSLRCRTYPSPTGPTGVPPKELLIAALR